MTVAVLLNLIVFVLALVWLARRAQAGAKLSTNVLIAVLLGVVLGAAAQGLYGLGSPITRSQADVVVTFDEDGLYWHPDHIVLHERTKSTVGRMGEEAPALYYVSMPKGCMRAAWNAAAEVTAHGQNGALVPPVVMGVEVDAFGLFTKPPTLTLDVRAFAVRKLHALRCHQSQVAGDALDRMPATAAPCVLGSELYRRADVGATRETFLDRMAAPR